MTWTTQPGTAEAEAATPELLHLVIAWSKDEPHRVGEVAAIAGPCLLGRGGAADSDSVPRLGFVRQRPATAQLRPPLEAPRISRTQLELSPTEDGRLHVRSVGRCPLLINGSEAKEGVVGRGDTLLLRNAAVFFVVRRPAQLPPLHSRGKTRGDGLGFGDADAQGLVGESPALWALRDVLGFAAQAERPVLLQGPAGSGKSLAARAIHALSERSDGPFVECAPGSRQPPLGEAELLGGTSPSLASPGQPAGLLAQASAGTLFLREVSELPATLQARLSAWLAHPGQGTAQLGSAWRPPLSLIASTCGSVAALHPALAAQLSFLVEVPELNSRREDIPLLLNHLLGEAAQSNPVIASRFFERRGGILAEPRIAPELIEALLRHHYTLQLRELNRLLWIALSTSRENVLALTPALATELRQAPNASAPPPDRSPAAGSEPAPTRSEIEAALASARQALEQQSQQILQLSDELRRQIEHRARRLMDALSSVSPRAGLGALAEVPHVERLLPGQTGSGTARSWQAGELLGDSYRVVRLLGTGGMGAVYEVERSSDQKRLAAKLLRELPDRAALGRFAREAYIMARCNHRNLLSVWDIDFTVDGWLYLVMELVHGSSLWQQRRRFGELAWALPILRQIADALHALHSQGVVHRDLKPENILLALQPVGVGLVKLADFGISRLLDGSADEEGGTASGKVEVGGLAPGVAARSPVDAQEALQLGQQETLALAQLPTRPGAAKVAPDALLDDDGRQRTGTGVIFGTPLYMAPELLQGSRHAEAPADVFSFGVLAYELLSGEPPFAKPPLLLHAAGQLAPPAGLASRCPGLSAEVAQLIAACLSPQPSGRPTMESVRRVLGPAASGPS